MVIDLKYHIITIMTIFISLGIGILIGSTMGGNELIIEQQQRLIGDLEHKLNQLRTQKNDFEHQITKLKDRLEKNIKFQETVLPLVVKDQLKGDRLLIVTGNDVKENLQEEVVQIFKLAGVEEVKVRQNKLESPGKFDKILLLGTVKKKIKEKYGKGKESVSVTPAQLSTISDLVKVVFQFTSKDLKELRSGKIERKGLSVNSSLQ